MFCILLHDYTLLLVLLITMLVSTNTILYNITIYLYTMSKCITLRNIGYTTVTRLFQTYVPHDQMYWVLRNYIIVNGLNREKLVSGCSISNIPGPDCIKEFRFMFEPNIWVWTWKVLYQSLDSKMWVHLSHFLTLICNTNIWCKLGVEPSFQIQPHSDIWIIIPRCRL